MIIYVMDDRSYSLDFVAIRTYYINGWWVYPYSYRNCRHNRCGKSLEKQKKIITFHQPKEQKDTGRLSAGGNILNNKKDTFENNKEKITGQIKEAAGKISGNEQLELKGRIQSSKADFKKNINIHNNVDEVKEGIAGKINDMLDKKDAKKDKK